MRRSGKPERSPQLHAPVSLSCGNWILWKPRVDPVLLRRDAVRSFKIKRKLKIAATFSPIPLFAAATALIDSLLIRIPLQVWFALALCLVLVVGYTIREWGKVEQRSRVGRFDEFSWIDDLAGSQCLTRRTSHTPSVADRMVGSLATVAYSRASTEGWISHGDVLQLHEIAWESLTENHALNLVDQGRLLDETAAMMERAARQTDRIDARLRDLEKSADLDVMTREFQDRQFRAHQISVDFAARLRFLTEHDRND